MKTINYETLKPRLDAGEDIKLIDVREPAEHAEYNIGGILLPLGKGALAPLPIKSTAGWHIFKIEDIRDARIPTYDELKPQILR